MTINARFIAKFFLYLAPLAVLIVASNMFFPFIVGKAIFFRVVITCGTLAYIAQLLFWSGEEEKRDAKETVKHPIFLSIAVFTICFLIASTFAVNPQIAFWSNFERGEGGLQMIYYALFFMLLALLLKTKKEWLNFLLYLVPIGAIVSLYAVGQRMNFLYIENIKMLAKASGGNLDQKLLQNNPWSGFFGDGARISGTLGNPLYISTFILFILLFITLLFLEKIKSTTGKVALGIIAIFEIIVFSMANSRNGLSGVIGGVIACLVLLAIRGKERRVWRQLSLRKFSFIFLALLVILGGLFYVTRTDQVCTSYGESATFGKTCSVVANIWTKVPIVNRFAKERILSGLDDRVWTWGSAIAGVIEKPILGWGPENFPIVFDRYYNANHFGSDSWFDRAHDAYLEYLVDGGIILLLAYLSIWFFYFREIYKKRSGMSIVMLGLFVGFPVAYLIQNISAFEVLPIYLMLYVFLALSIRLHNQPEKTVPEQKRAPVVLKPPGAPSFVIMGGVLILASLSLYYADYLPYWKNRELLAVVAVSDNENSQIIYQNFLKTLAYNSPIGQQESVQYFLLFIYRYLEDNSKSQDLKDKKGQLLKLVGEVDQIYKKNEASPHREVGVKTLSYLGLIHLRAAGILQDSQLLDSSQKLFEEGLALAPTRFEFIYPLLDIALIKGDRTKAKSLLGLAKNLRPDLARNTQYEKMLGETSSANTSLKAN